MSERDEIAIARSLRQLKALASKHPEAFDRRVPWSQDLGSLAEALSESEDPDMAKARKTVPIAFRLEPELIKRIDAHAKRMAEAMRPLEFTRVDALRALLVPALDAAEQAAAERGKRKA